MHKNPLDQLDHIGVQVAQAQHNLAHYSTEELRAAGIDLGGYGDTHPDIGQRVHALPAELFAAPLGSVLMHTSFGTPLPSQADELLIDMPVAQQVVDSTITAAKVAPTAQLEI